MRWFWGAIHCQALPHQGPPNRLAGSPTHHTYRLMTYQTHQGGHQNLQARHRTSVSLSVIFGDPSYLLSSRIFQHPVFAGFRHSDNDQSILIETSSCNLQLFSELITTQLRISHGVTASCLNLQSYKFYLIFVLYHSHKDPCHQLSAISSDVSKWYNSSR